ncbi:MAG TPA: hypothetical protein VFW62_05175, partial [bacterium]|nr:hypothetical protein [bacterium]
MNTSTDESASGLKSIRRSARNSLQRFPGVLISAALATGIVIHGVLTDGFNEENPRQWMLLLTCLLGISWLYSLSLIAERRLKPPWKTAAPLLIGAVTLALYYFRLSYFNLAGNPMAFGLEVAGLTVALHLFAAYAPFLGFRQPRAFWEYNRAIFLRFLLALFFSGTLLLGVTLFLSLLSLVTRGNFVQFYQ